VSRRNERKTALRKQLLRLESLLDQTNPAGRRLQDALWEMAKKADSPPYPHERFMREVDLIRGVLDRLPPRAVAAARAACAAAAAAANDNASGPC
jgi:hypothetical protein